MAFGAAWGQQMGDSLGRLERDITACGRCARLRAWCAQVAQVKRRAYGHEEYWGKPVPGFGDADARVYILGLAPGAHGANRTGRVFTGDRSGEWLYRALWETGFANQPESTHKGDGLELRGAWIGASVRCAPPANKPLPEEMEACREYVGRELALLSDIRVVVALGRVAHENYLLARGLKRSGFGFAHGAEHDAGGIVLIDSYHPSQQNTQTGRLTREMLRAVFERARRLAE
ncbi:MAG: uracil-DNA glycosylase [Bryobacteraceae bacterium]